MVSITWWPTVPFTAPLTSVKFITQVPGTLGEVQEVVQNTEPAALEPLTEGYEARKHVSEYGGVEQRWLVDHSEAAEERAKESAAKQRDREHEKEKREFCELLARKFSCRENAKKAVSAFKEGLTASVLTASRVV